VRRAGAPVPQIDPATGERMWIVARHRDVMEGLRHPDIGHEVGRHRRDERTRRPATAVERINARQLIDLDPPDHTRLRKLVSTAFTPRVVARRHACACISRESPSRWDCSAAGSLPRLHPRHSGRAPSMHAGPRGCGRSQTSPVTSGVGSLAARNGGPHSGRVREVSGLRKGSDDPHLPPFGGSCEAVVER
jgi:hypothetical protein